MGGRGRCTMREGPAEPPGLSSIVGLVFVLIAAVAEFVSGVYYRFERFVQQVSFPRDLRHARGWLSTHASRLFLIYRRRKGGRASILRRHQQRDMHLATRHPPPRPPRHPCLLALDNRTRGRVSGERLCHARGGEQPW